MAEFSYTARDRDGKIVKDYITAPTRETVGQLLRQQGLLPTLISEKRGTALNLQAIKGMFSHVSMLEKLTFLKNLGVTIKAGLPVSKALAVLNKQTQSVYFRKVVGQIQHNVESGKSLSDSMADYPRVFSPIVVSMIRVGENSGELDKILQYLGVQISRDYNLMRRAKGAMTYPAVVLGVLLAIGYLMFTYILPKLTETFKEFNAELPILTKVIIATVDIFSKYSYIILMAFVGIGVAFWFWRKTEASRRFLHRMNLVLPVLGMLTKKLNLARFTIVFSGLLKSGMPIVEALAITGDTMTNLYYQQALREASEKVKVGVDLQVALEKYPKLFTPLVTQMIQVGEESGTMETVLEEVATFYEAEIDDTVKNLSSIIEPVLVIIIGVVVGILAVGLIMPIYNITQSM
ncbi:type II secretion system F family protein [bacterium]|nr:MAG: type II secretion system F family protein [bacterium]